MPCGRSVNKSGSRGYAGWAGLTRRSARRTPGGTRGPSDPTLTPIPGADPSEIYKHARLAVEAGCDDAQILYIYTTNSWSYKQVDGAERKERMARSVAAFEKSAYSPGRRGVILMQFALSMMDDRITPEGRKEADRLLELALALIPPSIEEDGRGWEADRTRYSLAWDIITGRKFLLNDSEAAFRKVDAVLARSPNLQVLRLQIEGEFFADYAWEARGMGLAPTVRAEVWRLFEDRLRRAKRALLKAWEIEPSGSKTPTLMLPVLRGLGCERPEMETWFRRAMEADSDNYLACFQKMEWLDPKWHGSPEEALAFGRACKATKNWWSKITLLGAESHFRYVQTGPQDEFEKYFARADVWEDIRATFEEYLTNRPDDPAARSSYAALSYF